MQTAYMAQLYICMCVHTHTHKYTWSVYEFPNIYTYTAVVVLRIGWSNQLLTDRQTGLLPLAGCPGGRILHVAGSQYNTSLQLDQEDNTKARPGIRMNPFCRIVQGVLVADDFFFNPKSLFPKPKRRKQLSSRKGEKEDSGPLELGHEPARSRDSIQPLKGLGEEVATLGYSKTGFKVQPREAQEFGSWIQVSWPYLLSFSSGSLLRFKKQLQLESRFIQALVIFKYERIARL